MISRTILAVIGLFEVSNGTYMMFRSREWFDLAGTETGGYKSIFECRDVRLREALAETTNADIADPLLARTSDAALEVVANWFADFSRAGLSGIANSVGRDRGART